MLNPILKIYLKKRAERFQAFEKEAGLLQNKVLKKILKSAEQTAFAREFGINANTSYETFKEQVLLFNYDQLKPYVEQAIAGESDVLWPGKLEWLAKSSGTSSDRSKYIPVTHQFLNDTLLQGGRDALAFYTLQKPNHNLFKGKGLIMGGSHELVQQNHNIRTGDISAVMMQNMPAIARYFLTPKLETALIGDWQQKLELMLECGNQRVSNISGVPTWTLVLFRKLIEKYQTTNIKEVWPELELYIHGGVNFQPYRDEFDKLCDGQVDFLEVYNASEGFFAIQDKLNNPSMLLIPDYGIFYEFVPLDELSKEKPNAIPLTDVELNKDYAIYITTTAGLWRYQVGDTVRFTSLEPPRIQITGRVQAFINAFGEELMLHQSDKAILEVCHQQGNFLRDYSAAPLYLQGNEKGGHEWIIELDEVPQNPNFWIETLDAELQKLNSDYAAKRSGDIALTLPKVHFVEKGFFDHWLKNKGKLGGQNKVPRLRNDRKLMEELLTLVQK